MRRQFMWFKPHTHGPGITAYISISKNGRLHKHMFPNVQAMMKVPNINCFQRVRIKYVSTMEHSTKILGELPSELDCPITLLKFTNRTVSSTGEVSYYSLFDMGVAMELIKTKVNYYDTR